MEFNKTKIDDALRSIVNVKLVDPFGKRIAGLRYQVRQGTQIVARGVTNTEGKFSSFASIIGTILTVYVERFGTNEFKEIKKIIPWSEDFRIKLVSEKRKENLNAKEHQGNPGNYQRKTYKVCKDDTLGHIASQFETTAADLAALNGIAVTDIIHIDQILKVPNKPARSGAATSNATAPSTAPTSEPVSIQGPVSNDTGTATGASPSPAATSNSIAQPAPGALSASTSLPASVSGQETTLNVTGTPTTPSSSAPIPSEAATQAPTVAVPANEGASTESIPAKATVVTTPVPVAKEEDRGPNGTPKTVVTPVCDQSGCIKLGDKGQLIEELNLRLMGFGNTIHDPASLDEFTVATEKAVKQFQRDYMGVAESGKVCGAVLTAIDEFLIKYPISFHPFACQCGAHGASVADRCNGFGKARLGSASVSHLKNGANVAGVEKPGIHRALFWSLRAALFYLDAKESQLGFKFGYVASGYRCWKRAKQMGIFTTNHLGNACDVHFLRVSNNSEVTGDALESLKNKVFVSRMKARPKWDTENCISLEPKHITDAWVHMDVRMFKEKYLLPRYYAKTREAADGDPIATIARREGRLSLVNCGGSTPTLPVEAPISAPVATQKPTPAPKPPAKPPATNPQAQKPPPAAGKGSKKSPVTAGPAATTRKDPDSLHVSQLGLDFIRVWENGDLTTSHLAPYDVKDQCTVGVGHLVDGERSCAELASSGSVAYKKYAAGITVEEERALFAEDVERIRNRILPSLQVPLHQHEFDALMSLAFNTGGLKKFIKLLAKLNTKNYGGCCDEFADITSGGALTARRQSEMRLFRNNIYDANH
ncbi:glycoside hydrolase family protein [Duganella sp. Root336D2]|uniref:glycoside hydrolase family protein n=1 Tax=Duganella sp. Root336D2 TaxID=1736518 RepID=UPI0009EBA3CA|nr:LysM peptidoglycan-binding domain-containing protein [Duganella sp. Root336D2]